MGLVAKTFDYTVEYKPRRKHLQTDHLSKLSEDMGVSPIDDKLIDDNFFVLTANAEWYA